VTHSQLKETCQASLNAEELDQFRLSAAVTRYLTHKKILILHGVEMNLLRMPLMKVDALLFCNNAEVMQESIFCNFFLTGPK
jgi:hypothetical protein